jgi:predicted RNA-binding Zn ribbon-like protein
MAHSLATTKLRYDGGMVNVRDRAAPAESPRSWSDAPFRYIAGHVALDFVNTVDWTSAGLVDDRLGSYARLVEWSVGSGQLTANAATRLVARAARRPRRAARVLRDARTLRRAIRRVVLARLGREAADDALTTSWALAVLSRFLRATSAHRQLVLVRQPRAKRAPLSTIEWQWAGLDTAEPPLEAVVWMAAQAAGELVTATDVDRWRVCPSVACGWMFVDTTKNGRRRWCEMATCGMRAKDRRRRGPVRARSDRAVSIGRGGRDDRS